MTPPNPSSAAREAANETLANIMRKHIEDAARAEALAARLQSALSAERERRVAAEKIIQYAEEHMSPSFMACEADAYRKRFNVVSWPKGDDHG